MLAELGFLYKHYDHKPRIRIYYNYCTALRAPLKV